MARLPRIDLPGIPVHVVVRGVNRQACFVADADRTSYLAMLRDSAVRHRCAVHAFVLMTNHVHLLVTSPVQGALSAMMHRLGSAYVRRYNHAHGRTGTLFEGRYRSSLVQTERYLLACMRYIECNPVRAGLVGAPVDYPWSSYCGNAGGPGWGWLQPHTVYLELGTTPEARAAAYRALFRTAEHPAEIEAIRLQVRRNCALGDAVFQEAITVAMGRRARIVDAGRPRHANGAVGSGQIPENMT